MTSRPYPDPASRFQILPSPILSPAQCMVCGNPNRAVVDFSKELEVNGFAFRVYVCILCLRDANAQVEGYLESIGQDTGGVVSPVLLEKYLRENELKVISNANFDSLVFWATGSSAAVDAVLADPLNSEVAETDAGDDSENELHDESDTGVDSGSIHELDDREPTFTL